MRKKIIGQSTWGKIRWIKETRIWLLQRGNLSVVELAWLDWAKSRLFELEQSTHLHSLLDDLSA